MLPRRIVSSLLLGLCALCMIISAHEPLRPLQLPRNIPPIRIPESHRTLLRTTPSARLQSLGAYELVSIDVNALLSPQSPLTTEQDQPVFPTEATIKVAALGYDTVVHLSRNDKLFHPNYTETRQAWIDGQRRRDLEQEPVKLGPQHQCYYQGTVEVLGESNTYSMPRSQATSDPYSAPVEGIVAANLCQNAFEGVIYATLPAPKSAAQFQPEAPSLPLRTITLVFESALQHLTAEQIETHITLQTLHRLSLAGTALTEAARAESHAQDIINLEQLHIVYLMEDLKTPPGSCGVGIVDGHSHAPLGSSNHSHSHPDIGFGSTLNELKKKAQMQMNHTSDSESERNSQAISSEVWIELLIANDHERYLQMDAATESNSAAIINVVSALYTAASFYPKISVVLTAQITFAIQDPWAITKGDCVQCSANEVGVSELLSKWNLWRSGSNAPAHDNGHLLSGYDFEDGVLGYAGVGSMCYPAYSGGVDQSYLGNPPYTGAIVAHEIGHNLGSQHDGNGNPCPASGYIMNAYVSSSQAPTEFSSCSKDYIATFLTTSGSATCLENQPSGQWSEIPVCGNGLVEAGEQCDCGQGNCSGVDPCCDGATCMFVSGAQCSFGQPCCKNDCTIVPKSDNLVCRSSVDVCDIAETCDGTTGACPINAFLGAGRSCTSVYGEGACYNGVCTSLLRQCQSQNSNSGESFGVCPSQKTLNNGNICGDLYCKSTQSTGSACNYFTNAGVVVVTEDGIPCGDRKQCYAGQCVESKSIDSIYAWEYDDWQPCWSCLDTQIRTATCLHKTTLEPVADELCSFPESLSRLCVNPTIGCTGEASSGNVSSVDVFGVNLSSTAAILIFVALVIFYLFIMGLCYYYLRAGIVSDDAVNDIDAYIKRLADDAAFEREDERKALSEALQERTGGFLDRDEPPEPKRRHRRK